MDVAGSSAFFLITNQNLISEEVRIVHSTIY